MLDMHMSPRLFAREEVEAKPAGAQNGRTHCVNIPDPTGTGPGRYSAEMCGRPYPADRSLRRSACRRNDIAMKAADARESQRYWNSAAGRSPIRCNSGLGGYLETGPYECA